MTLRITFLFLITSCISVADPYAEWKKKERIQWFEERQTWIEQARKETNGETVDKLARILFGVGGQLDTTSPEVRDLYVDAQEILLATPGHAQYFADKLAILRENTENPWMNTSYQREYYKTRDILTHLPSPETIRVLGELLESEEDIKSREEIVAIRQEQSRQGGSNFLPYPRALASSVLGGIGLRDYSPVETPHKIEPVPLPLGSGDPWWQSSHPWWISRLEWWAEVKSGQRSFSFKGQTVEYRFLPDGSVEETEIPIPPEELAAREAEAPVVERAPKKARPPEPAAAVRKENHPFPWIAAVAGILLVSVWWIVSAERRKRPKAEGKE